MPTPQLLVSVRETAEVAAALEGGADWIDLKEPQRGALGAVDVQVATEIVATVSGRCPVSAALGEIDNVCSEHCQALLKVPGIAVVKIGLHGAFSDGSWRDKWLHLARMARTRNKHLAAVIYADWQTAAVPAPSEILELALLADSRYLLIDTFGKKGGSLPGIMTTKELTGLLILARSIGMSTLVAGGLSIDDLEKLPLEWIDRVAVRGRVCRGGRSGAVDGELVREFRSALNLTANRHPSMVNRLRTGVSET